MKTSEVIPTFAIIGHPNEGKSSVVSTLAENDRVRISATPGETLVCETYPVIIDDNEIIRFVDTPGFQNPRKTLHWMKDHQVFGDRIVQAFIEKHAGDPDMTQDCELLTPVAKGAGIIYVVDGSRPIRNVDKAEMEILRLTGAPRMAIINFKEDDTEYLDEWKSAFRRHFNSIRIFNAHRATYAERISLLESLKGIDQDWISPLSTVISAFRQDWEHRTMRSAAIIVEMLEKALDFSVTKNYTKTADEEEMKRKLFEKYTESIRKIESSAHQQIRKLYKHNIFNYDLPPQSIIHQDLFNEKTWQVLGLTRTQLATIAAITGGTIGAALDIAAAGITFGVFTLIGGAIGGGWAALSGRQLADSKIGGVNLGGQQIRVGPNENIQFLYILVDRALIYFEHIINWAHGRRESAEHEETERDTKVKAGYTSGWNTGAQRKCMAFFRAIRSGDVEKKEKTRKAMKELLRGELRKMYGGEG
jgi:GTPase Era involved in 16S rRNA processing